MGDGISVLKVKTTLAIQCELVNHGAIYRERQLGDTQGHWQGNITDVLRTCK